MARWATCTNGFSAGSKHIAAAEPAVSELRIDKHVFEIRIEDGRCTTTEGLPSHTADVVITTDMSTLHDLLARRISAEGAIARGRIDVQGDTRALDRLVELFALDESSVTRPARRARPPRSRA